MSLRSELGGDVPLLHDSDATGWRAWFEALNVQLKPRTQDRRSED